MFKYLVILTAAFLAGASQVQAQDKCFVLRNYTDAECVMHIGNTEALNKCKARRKYAEPPAQPVILSDSQVVSLNGVVLAEPPKLCYVLKPKKNKVLGYQKMTQRHAFLATGQTVIQNPNIGTIDNGFINPTPPPAVNPPVAPVPETPPEPTTSTITRNVPLPVGAKPLIWQFGSSTLPAPAKVYFGQGGAWVSKTYVSGTVTCDKPLFDGFDPIPGTYKDCYYILMSDLEQILKPIPGVNQQPVVNRALEPVFPAGVGIAQIGPAGIPPTNPAPYAGAFRIACEFSHMSNDDPIVFPGVPNATHHHTFFGNHAITAYTTMENIRLSGNSTCAGGILNRSGYWMPSLIDMTNGAPVKPTNIVVYYKAADEVSGQFIKPPPAALRMIAGNPRPLSIADSRAGYFCQDQRYTGRHPDYGIIWEGKTIQSCGGEHEMLRMIISFPQCWDGQNLDSPDHQSHMAYICGSKCNDGNGGVYNSPNSCPASHPVQIPSIAINADFRQIVKGRTYRLSSDNYSHSIPGGYSLHADWMNGWDESIIARFVKSCLNERRNCGGPNLGDGQTLTGFFVD